MAIFHFDNLAKNLPDCYKKDDNSNNFKILEIDRIENNNLRATLNSINEIFDIDNATGSTLDMYGERFGQQRGSASDSQYRIMIKSKIVRSYCDGSYKNIVDALCYTFGCDIEDVEIREEGAACVSFTKAPLTAIVRAGFSPSEADAIIKAILPVGVKLNTTMYEGTFEFGTDEYESGIEMDAETGETTYTGFVNAEGNGGRLGYASSSEKQGDLPI